MWSYFVLSERVRSVYGLSPNAPPLAVLKATRRFISFSDQISSYQSQKKYVFGSKHPYTALLVVNHTNLPFGFLVLKPGA